MTKKRLLTVAVAGSIVIAAVLSIPVPPPAGGTTAHECVRMNLEQSSKTKNAGQPLRLLFIHHSCGGQWLAATGPDEGTSCIYKTAVNGGDLRTRLEDSGYELHEASYGSLVGDKTDIFDWPHKFNTQLEKILTCDRQDEFYNDSRKNRIVVFKPCFPNNLFVGGGKAPRVLPPPGKTEEHKLTVENAKAAYGALLKVFQENPDTLFVAITAPPLALGKTPLYKLLAKKLLGRPNVRRSGRFAREFNNWMADTKSGWLSQYQGKNVVVFDLYDVLTDGGASDFSRYPSGEEADDSHPSSKGNRKATEKFMKFIGPAVDRAGLRQRGANGGSIK